MTCCGALTKVYSDAGKRTHHPDCPLNNVDAKAARDELFSLIRYENPGEVVAVTKSGRQMTHRDFEALADEAERGYDVSHLTERQ
jgi:hypothetical protein